MGSGIVKKITIRVAAPLLLLVGIGVVSYQVMGEADPILIENCQQLQDIKENPNEHYELKSKIDCTNHEGFQPIREFTGIFDGNNNKIVGLTLDFNEGQVALFAEVIGAQILNTKFENLTVRGGWLTGGIVGSFQEGSVMNNIHVTGGSVYGRPSGNARGVWVGGLIAHAYDNAYKGGGAPGSVINSSFEGSVDGEYNPDRNYDNYPTVGNYGGLVGEADTTVAPVFLIRYCYFKGTVFAKGVNDGFSGGLVGYGRSVQIEMSGADVMVRATAPTQPLSGTAGGLVGTLRSSSGGSYNLLSSINDSFATGIIIGGGKAGGSVGSHDDEFGLQATITNSYAVTVLGGTKIGGLVASETGGTVSVSDSSWWAYDIAGTTHSVGGGTPKSSEDMKKQATFHSWDFGNIWEMNEGKSYPYPTLPVA